MSCKIYHVLCQCYVGLIARSGFFFSFTLFLLCYLKYEMKYGGLKHSTAVQILLVRPAGLIKMFPKILSCNLKILTYELKLLTKSSKSRK